MSELIARLAAAETPARLKFGLYQKDGWVVASDADTVRLLCDVWNARKEIAAALSQSTQP